MKKLLIAFVLLTNIMSFAQSESSEGYLTEVNITKTHEHMLDGFINEYFNHVKVLDIDKLLEVTHPGLFEISSKELIKQQLDAGFNNELFTMTFTNMSFAGIDEAYEYQKVTYYIAKYNSSFSMNFKQSAEQTDEDFEGFMNYLMELYKIQFKDDNVVRKDNIITISGLKRLLIVDDPSLDGLKMLEIKPGMNSIFKRFIPEVVVNALGNS